GGIHTEGDDIEVSGEQIDPTDRADCWRKRWRPPGERPRGRQRLQQDRRGTCESARTSGLDRPAKLWRANRRETPIFYQPFQIFPVSRHSINRVVFFPRRAAEEKYIVVVDPNAVPTEQFFWR